MSNHYASFPNLNIRRNFFDNPFRHHTTFNFGTLNVVDVKEVLPGQTDVCKFNALIRMSTPIAPIMDDVKVHVHAFYVPWRLVWNHTAEFFGENKTSAGPQTTTYYLPQKSLFVDGVPKGSISHQMHKPYVVADNSKTAYGKANILKERGYYLIASEWYRNQQVQNPFIVATDDSSDIVTINGVPVGTDGMPIKVNKNMDLFTTATLYAQYTAVGVSVPLGAAAPVVTGSSHAVSTAPVTFIQTDGNPVASGGRQLGMYNGALTDSAAGDYAADAGVTFNNLYADLSQATAANLNQLYYAAALQKFLYRSNFGSRYFEMLAAHYGVQSPDARLQRPEYLGGKTFYLNIDQVLSTAGYSPDASTSVGAPGANSCTFISCDLYTKGFVESGYVYILISTSQNETYSQGILKEDAKKDRFEIWSPEFNALGDDLIKNEELLLTGTSADKLGFGYAEHWYEYKTRQDHVSGDLDPAVPNSLDYWTLANKFNSTPSLDETFVTRNRDNISRCLVTGNSGPDFIADFLCLYREYKGVALYADPGFGKIRL